MFAFVRKLARRRRLEREIQEELAFHIQTRAEDIQRTGISPAEALRRARIEFGGAEQYKEQLRDTRRFAWIEDFFRDLAYSCRSLRSSPVFAISAAGAIALGIGVNTALFSLIYSVLYRPLPVRDPGAVRIVYMTTRGQGPRTLHGSSYFVSFREFQHMRAQATSAELSGVSEANVTATFAPNALHVQLASDNFLSVLGATPALGRFFTPEEAASPGSVRVAVLSYDTWQTHFNGSDVTGRVVTLNRTAFTIIGVAPRGFYGPLVLKADLWIPVTMQAITRAGESLVDDPNAGFIEVFARKKPGVADPVVCAEMQVLAQQAVSAHAPAKRAAVVIAPGAMFNYPEVTQHSVPVLAILFGVVSLVLLVACANVANMLVARGFGRSREIAIRLSIGAGKGRLIRQLLTEHMLLGLLGGAGGLVLSQFGVRALLSAIPLGNTQLDVSPDFRIAAWTLAVALAAGALFGLPSAIGMTRTDLTQSLRGDSLESRTGRRRFRLQSVLIAAQVAASALLLIDAGLLLRAASNAFHMDPGMALHNVLLVKANVRDLQFTAAEAERYLEKLRAHAAAIPGVTTAALTGFEPIVSSCGGQAGPVEPDGSAKTEQISCPQVGPGFLHAMNIRLLAGRDFEPADVRDPKVAIVDEAFARRFLPGNPIGRRIRMGSTPADDRTVIGVTASTRRLLFLEHDYPQVYTPLEGIRHLDTWLVLSYEGPRAPLVRALKSIEPQLDREVALTIKPIEENVSNALSVVRMIAGGVTALGALALLLACSGVYGVVAFTVGHRRREIGIRLALGAHASSVMRLLVWQSLRPVFVGAALGTAMAAVISTLIRAILYGVNPLDPAGFGGALLLLAAVAAIAALVPASSALRVDPAATLRHD
ncbi:MAG TPA: ADOP family duplicated permease [Candidatus Solibacter sp.]|nr:ADOP family duplicated permease [Candidatus Solibacter sp.]